MTFAPEGWLPEGGTGKSLQPMNAKFGLLPPLETLVHSKKLRYEAYSQRALEAMEEFTGKNHEHSSADTSNFTALLFSLGGLFISIASIATIFFVTLRFIFTGGELILNLLQILVVNDTVTLDSFSSDKFLATACRANLGLSTMLFLMGALAVGLTLRTCGRKLGSRSTVEFFEEITGKKSN